MTDEAPLSPAPDGTFDTTHADGASSTATASGDPVAARRRFLATCAAYGVGGTLLPGVLWASLQGGAEITPATVAAAEEIAGVRFSDTQRELLATQLKQQAQAIDALHKVPLDNAVSPAVHFDPLAAGTGAVAVPPRTSSQPFRTRAPRPSLPANRTDIAFLGIAELHALVRTKQLSARELLALSLERIAALDPKLLAVVSVTEERARRQAQALDDEAAKGRFRGPLHGIPWGAKDLLAVKGYRTTWGSGAHREQVIDTDATVVQRLDAAGAVLVAKLTLGELAQGDNWFGGITKNPWNPAQGSSGSSAGPGSAVAAGLVTFAIGSETLGSISSPSTRNGVTGLRPTFGAVPRTGAMALSWTMDKLGPMARSTDDCRLVFSVIRGADGQDPTARLARDGAWVDDARPLAQLRIGVVQSAFDANPQRSTRAADDAALAALRAAGATPVPVTLPDAPYAPLRLILTAEAAAAFDELTRTGRDAQLVQQGPNAWPATFRTARFIPAVDYVNANRVRTQVMRQWATFMASYDAIVVPTNGTQQLLATNLTGHPAVILPHGFVRTSATDATEVPVSITVLGGLHGEASALRVAQAIEAGVKANVRRPPVAV
jgi:Asp-tRNA(Asn)/Glu-tRNA(Gln) amidotransferase A subunit family amidase